LDMGELESLREVVGGVVEMKQFEGVFKGLLQWLGLISMAELDQADCLDSVDGVIIDDPHFLAVRHQDDISLA
jgi:hypothetical protein